MPQNTDNTPILPAGSYPVVATVRQVGKVTHGPNVQPFGFPLELTSLDKQNGDQNGGYSLLLAGTGFPLNAAAAKITICGQDATILSINNIQATIIVPSCPNLGLTQIIISNGISTSNFLDFEYLAPNPPAYIFTVNPQSHNPTLKGIMEITGIGFTNGSTIANGATNVRVDLANSSGKVYGMRIITINDTYIKVGIPGGLAGNYKV